VTQFRYNHDLLLSPQDLAAAKDSFPKIFPALDHPELRTRFAAIDEVANRMKASSRGLGTLSIFLVTLALVSASTAHLTQPLPGTKLWGSLATICGLVGLLIGGFGVMHSSRKQRWLLHRFATERLRQFFFQTQVVLAGEIVRAGASGDWAAFLNRRAAAFRQLEQMLDAELPERLELALSDAADIGPSLDRWMLDPDGTAPGPVTHSDAAEQLKGAYRSLRLNGQRTFAQHKLRETGRWMSSFPADQLRTFQRASGGAILLSVILHLAVAGSIVAGSETAAGLWLDIAAIWLAIFALAVRTLDQGLRPGADVERYSAYRDGARNLLGRFDTAKTWPATLEAMRDMETLSYDEMISFLRSNRKATFSM